MAYPQETFCNVDISKTSLIGRRRETALANTLLYQLEVLKQTGRYDAFKLEWHPCYSDPPDVWPIPNHLFWDSDIAKWIEGACYFLHNRPNNKIDSAIRQLVDMISAAQQPDGYINIHFTVVEPGKRFTNLRDFHELYNAGHLIEAALAHNFHYKNDDFLRPVLKYVDLLCRTFGPWEEQIHGYPGHPEIELALLRLFDRTGNENHLALAKYFIMQRGNPTGDHGQHFYVMEAKRRDDDPHKRPDYWPSKDCLWYYQANLPIVEQQTIEGHSVRAMYLLTGVADLVRQEPSSHVGLKDAVYRLWNNMVGRKMYVTGGIGAIKQWEGFGIDHYLPQGSDEGGCYAETCAAIGVMMLAQRILQFDLDRAFSDTMELCLFNAVLTAMSCNGKRFTYVNQLASSEQDLSQRAEWFTCACCPPNILRLLGQIGGYVYSQEIHTDDDISYINVHLYLESCFDVDVRHGKVKISQRTNWPWDGSVQFDVENFNDKTSLRLRIPAWAETWTISPNLVQPKVKKGYLTLPGSWLLQNPSFELSVPLSPRLLTVHPATNQDFLAVARGPLIYCIEDVDNTWVQDHFKMVLLDPYCQMKETVITDKSTSETYVGITVNDGASLRSHESLNCAPAMSIEQSDRGCDSATPIHELHFVPFYFKANRGGRGHARVGLKRWLKQKLAE